MEERRPAESGCGVDGSRKGEAGARHGASEERSKGRGVVAQQCAGAARTEAGREVDASLGGWENAEMT